MVALTSVALRAGDTVGTMAKWPHPGRGDSLRFDPCRGRYLWNLPWWCRGCHTCVQTPANSLPSLRLGKDIRYGKFTLGRV